MQPGVRRDRILAIRPLLGPTLVGAIVLAVVVASQTAPSTKPVEAAIVSPRQDLGSLERCGCVVRNGSTWDQPSRCRLRDGTSLVGLSGFLKARFDKRRPPWYVTVLKQTGPTKWDRLASNVPAKTAGVVVEESLEGGTSALVGRLSVKVEGSTVPIWVDVADFDPVPWWRCSAEKAIVHANFWAEPDPGSRPIDVEGRWREGPPPKSVWCYSASDLGVYCDPKPQRSGFGRDWIFKKNDLRIVY